LNRFEFDCERFNKMSPFERKGAVYRSGRCFNCLSEHPVRDCKEKCQCRLCEGSGVYKHFHMLHEYFVPGVPGSGNFRNFAPADRDRNSRRSKGPIFSNRSVKVDSTKTAMNRMIAARIINHKKRKKQKCILSAGRGL